MQNLTREHQRYCPCTVVEAGHASESLGGSIVLSSGSSKGSKSGDIIIGTKETGPAQSSGSILLSTGGTEGDFDVRTGPGGSISLAVQESAHTKGGSVSIKAGSTLGSPDGGELFLSSGSSIIGKGGSVNILGGSSASGSGGSVTISSGASCSLDAGDLEMVASSSDWSWRSRHPGRPESRRRLDGEHHWKPIPDKRRRRSFGIRWRRASTRRNSHSPGRTFPIQLRRRDHWSAIGKQWPRQDRKYRTDDNRFLQRPSERRHHTEHG